MQTTSLLLLVIAISWVFFIIAAIITSRYLRKKLHAIEEKNLTLEANKLIHSKNTECINQLTHYDNLTGLPTRIFFNETLNKSISHAKRRNQHFALLLIDIDFGNMKEDQLLKETANRLTKSLRNEDIIAKMSDNEFIILLNDIVKPKFASSVAEKLLKLFEKPFLIHEKELKVTASIGICIYPMDGDSLEGLLTAVDTATTQVKQQGGNHYQFYTEEADKQAREFIEIEQGLKKAIDQNELLLYFQPKLHIKQGYMTGVEALIRWKHPTLGFISPTKFIPIAEETGLIMELGEWILHEACKINKFWQKEGYKPLTIAVNLSEKQFLDPVMPTIIKKVLDETELSPEYLEIEITEEIVMGDIEKTSKILDNIKATHVNISMDHFGTGYTSIKHLKQLPINTIKIDHEYIKGIPLNPNDCSVTSALISLAHKLGLEVVAEGVETAEQLQFLAMHECDVVQGYFLSHPAPQDKIVSQFTKITEMY